MHGFAKSHRKILLYGYFSLGFLLFHLLLLLLSQVHLKDTMLFTHHSSILHLFLISSAQGSDYKALEHQRLASSLEHSVSGL